MSKIQSDAKNGNYIEDFAELDDLFRLYDVYKTQSVNRETAAHMMQDLCFNNALDATGDIVAQVKDASRAVASMLDPDKDDDIPLETLATFCRLSRMQLLHDSQHGSKPFKFALIVVDVQNDFINGPMPVQVSVCWRESAWLFLQITRHGPEHCYTVVNLSTLYYTFFGRRLTSVVEVSRTE